METAPESDPAKAETREAIKTTVQTPAPLIERARSQRSFKYSLDLAPTTPKWPGEKKSRDK